MKLTNQIEYQDKDWTLFNIYHYLQNAKADQKCITKFPTIILKSNDKDNKYFLYQEAK